MVSKFNEIFLGYHLHQVSVLNLCFKYHLSRHFHQGYYYYDDDDDDDGP